MKSLLHILFVLVWLLGFGVGAKAAVPPFVRVDWGVAPGQVMDVMGVPAFNRVDFALKQTEYLAYRQTISAYNFVFYYLFKDEKLYQVRLELREELAGEELKGVTETVNGLLENALTASDGGFSETTVQNSPPDAPFASSVWWNTPATFAVVLVDTAVADTPVFDVMLADAQNSANAALINRYSDMTAQIKAHNEAEALKQQSGQRFAEQAPKAETKGFMSGLKGQIAALATGALDKLLGNMVIALVVLIVVILLVMLLRKKRAAGRAEGASRLRTASAKPAPKTGAKFSAKGVSKGNDDERFVAGGQRSLRMVSASKTGGTKGTKLSFRK